MHYPEPRHQKETYIPFMQEFCLRWVVCLKGKGQKTVSRLKLFWGSSLRANSPEKKTKIQQFRYQQFVEGFSLQPIGIVHCNSFEGGSTLWTLCGRTYTVLAHLKEGWVSWLTISSLLFDKGLIEIFFKGAYVHHGLRRQHGQTSVWSSRNYYRMWEL